MFYGKAKVELRICHFKKNSTKRGLMEKLAVFYEIQI